MNNHIISILYIIIKYILYMQVYCKTSVAQTAVISKHPNDIFVRRHMNLANYIIIC